MLYPLCVSGFQNLSAACLALLHILMAGGICMPRTPKSKRLRRAAAALAAAVLLSAGGFAALRTALPDIFIVAPG